MDEDDFMLELQRRLGVAPVQPARTLADLLARWEKAHGRLASFDCDAQRARRLLGLEPFELRDEIGLTRLVPYAPDGKPLGARDVSALTGEDVDDFRVWFYLQTTRRKGAPATATVNRYVMMLKRVLNHSVKRGTIQRSPLLGYDDEDEDNAREVVIEEWQLAQLLEALGSDAVMRALVTLAYDSGMRLTELRCCRWSWLYADAGQVHVPGAVAKNGEARVTDLSVRAWDALQELPRAMRGDAVFFNPETFEPYGQRWIHDRFVAAVERAGIVGADGSPPRLHDLRRSFITLMDRRGVKRAVGMLKSGHKSEAVYRRYRIVAEEELREGWLRMEAARQIDLAAIESHRRAPARAPQAQIDTKRKRVISR